MVSYVHPDHERLDLPLYSQAEAARLARIAPATARAWLVGDLHPRDEHNARSSFMPESVANLRNGVSFLGLVELAVVGELRRFHIGLHAIRRIVDVCREALDVMHPLASRAFRTDGREIFARHDGILAEVLHHQGIRIWDGVLDPFVKTLDYESDLARRWWPLGKDRLVVIDPDFGFGFPVIKGTAVRTEILFERFKAGESPEEIATDFRLDTKQVQRALQYEAECRAA